MFGRMVSELRTTISRLGSRRLSRSTYEAVTNAMGTSRSTLQSPSSQAAQSEVATDIINIGKVAPQSSPQPTLAEATRQTYVSGNYASYPPRDTWVLALLTGLGTGGILATSALGWYIQQMTAALQREMDQRLTAQEKMNSVQLAAVNQRFDAVNQRFDAVNQRFDAVDKRLDSVDKRLDSVDKGISEVKQELVVRHK